MVEKIILNLGLGEVRDIVFAAQNLVNEQFNKNARLLSGKQKRNFFYLKLKRFSKAVNNSQILSSEEKELFSKLEDNKVYELAREIILWLIKKEIKDPLD